MLDKIWKFFCSLKLTGILFGLLIISVLVGSFVIQQNNAQEGQIERAYSPETIQIFHTLGFLDLFHSPWFDLFLFLLGVNIICCSIDMWPRHVKKAFRRDPKLSETAIQNQPNFSEVKFDPAQQKQIELSLASKLKKYFKKPEMFSEGSTLYFYVNKMKLAHFGVYIVHVGLIIVFLGGIWGSIDGFEGQMSLMENQSSNRVYVKNAQRKNLILDFTVKCHDITLITYENGSAKDYMSDLEVFDKDGKSVKRQVIEVNHPLEYEGIKFYQANYGKQKVNESQYYLVKYTDNKTQKEISLKIPDDGSKVAVPGTNRFLVAMDYNENSQIPTDQGVMPLGAALRLTYGDDKKKEDVIIFKEYPDLDAKMRPQAKEKFVFGGIRDDFELKEVTGLQVSRDGGAPIVFTGCGFVVAGILWAFFTSHQKVWVQVKDGVILMGGRGHRNPWGFKAKFAKLVEELNGELKKS